MKRFNLFCAILSILAFWYLRPVQAQEIDTPDPWNTFVSQAMTLSMAQNGGIVNDSKECDPLQHTCDYAIFWRLEDGSVAMVKRTADYKNDTLQRVVCMMDNKIYSVKCMDYDTGFTSIMKQGNGRWISTKPLHR